MSLTENIYETLTDDEDTGLCDDIDAAACSEAPQSFVLILLSYILTKLGDAIANPKTTLAWLTTSVGAPAFVLGFLVPVRESGSMIPQLFIGGLIRRAAVRKWIWVVGSCGQCLCIVVIGFAALLLHGAAAGWVILGCVALFSLFRSLSSVAAKDVLGKTIPKPKRGQLNGWSASAAGLISIMVGITLMLPVARNWDVAVLGMLLVAAGLLWLLGAIIYAQIPEPAGETDGGRNALASLKKMNLLWTDKPFRRFVLTRALLMCSALSAPFYVAQAQSNEGSTIYLLGAFVAAAGLASLVSAPVWGRFADSSSKKVMIVAATITSATGIATFLVVWLVPGLGQTAWFLPLAYFALSVAHSGVRVGRKTYVVNLATGNTRTDYVAISNTTIGVLLLVVGSVGTLVSVIGNAGVIGLLAAMGAAGAVLGLSLPDVENNS